MYPDKKFLVGDRAEIRTFVERYPFATLVATSADGGYGATHIPLLVHRWDDEIVFRGHLMRQTDHWEALRHATTVFASFLGPDAPVLGSWQLTPSFGGTWNYQAVHIQGVLQGRDQAALIEHLETLKNRFESSPEHRFHSLPDGYVEALLPHIECVDFVVTDLKCIFKLSQNRSAEEFDRTVEGLRQQGGKSLLVAEEMQSRRPQYFATGT